MPDLVPVNHDPFAAPTLTPVDHDPFAGIDDSRAPFGTMAADEIPAGTLQGQVLKHLSTDAIIAPFQAAQEFMDNPSPESSFNVAASLVGVGMLGAEKNAAGIFGGRLSKIADHNAIARAENMESAGANSGQIWSMTRTARGADGKWRQEIDDSAAKLKMQPSELKAPEIDPNHISRSGDFIKSTYADEVLDHPDLFKAYPDAKDINIAPLPNKYIGTGTRGVHDPNTNTIHLSQDLSPEEAKSTLLHEMQHWVQKREGFARGDSPETHMPPELAPARQNFETVKANTQAEIASTLDTNATGIEYMKDLIRREKYGPDAAQHDISESFQKVFQNILDKNPEVKQRLGNLVDSEKLLNDADTKAHTLYSRAMGEVEARNVQQRLLLRTYVEPRLTEDTPRFLQRNTTPRLVPVDHNPFAASAEYPIAPRSEWYGDANYQQTGGKLVNMTPDEFLAKARPMKVDDVARENIDDLKNHIQSGKTLDPLAIYKNGKEDGRHRAYAAKELGITQVPVLTWPAP